MNPDDEHHDGNDELSAGPNDPWIKVHVLSEFVFCKRAGIVAFEAERDDLGVEEEDPRANVNYMPRHELDAIIRDIEHTTQSLVRWLPVPIVSALVTLTAGWWLGWCPAVVGIFLTMGLSKPIFTALDRLKELKELYAYTQSRKPIEPDPLNSADQRIDWWELHKAGFESFAPPRKLDDESVRLAGKPWRILRREHLMIPVFKKKMSGKDPEKIEDTHYARSAAYCHLLQQGAGVESPYGIVLFDIDNEFEGRALNFSAARKKFRDGLVMARLTVRDSKGGVVPDAAYASLCNGCPHGKPMATKHSTLVRPGSDLSLPLLVAKGADEREYHSDCGDRFNWIPPHEKALKKELKPS